MSQYTAIEPDITADEPVSSFPSLQPQTPSAPPTQPQSQSQQAPAQTQTGPTTWAERLRESSHPVALLFYIFFRLSSIFVYIFGNLFLGFITQKNRFILHFISIILLVAADFWNLKNIAGRLLVGLRWWNETNPVDGKPGEFENVWVFESADPNRYINPIDSRVFWALLYGVPIAWGVLGVLAVLKLQFLYLLLIIISFSLSLTNGLAYTKCDKFGKANNLATDLFSRATGNIFNRMNPFGRA
ncbi:Golgi apparatus membrane protein TVP23 [Scheffersomyces coipomensis]|uniref:Golgi apparatus membrane protein TVP23 n=1 Tax=Scheffersomyces coipomensis TaxID=1788519 RepID=UPI00315CE37B